MNITIDLLKNTFSKKGYKWQNDEPNLIAIRTNLQVPDVFNDLFHKERKLIKNWMKMHYKLCSNPAIADSSMHFMVIARKK